MLYGILGVLALLIVGLFAYAATQPNTFRIERSIVMDSPPEPIFGIISDFHQSIHWSPWEKLTHTRR